MATVPKMKTLLAGLAFGESPRWHGDRLWLADWGAQEVVAVDLEGNSKIMDYITAKKAGKRLPPIAGFALMGIR
jgi:sugar lactone lactonase YvrE